MLLVLLVGVLLLFVGIALFTARLVRPLAARPTRSRVVGGRLHRARVAARVPSWLVRRGCGARGRRGGRRAGRGAEPVLLVIVALMALRRRLSSGSRRARGVPERSAGPASTEIGGANSRRDPQRTASTAAALMIGLALVTLVATLGAGIIRPFEQAVDQIFAATTRSSRRTTSPRCRRRRRGGHEGAGGRGDLQRAHRGGQAFGETISVTAVDSQAPEVLRLDWQQGSQASSAGSARRRDRRRRVRRAARAAVGSPFRLTTIGGTALHLTVRGIFKPPAGGSPFGKVTISSTAFDATNPQPQNLTRS